MQGWAARAAVGHDANEDWLGGRGHGGKMGLRSRNEQTHPRGVHQTRARANVRASCVATASESPGDRRMAPLLCDANRLAVMTKTKTASCGEKATVNECLDAFLMPV